MVAAIRTHDHRHLITVGVIPWALTFPKAKPFFYASDVGENLDFVSVHFYPKKGEIDEALTALRVYQIGKPVVIEETFPLKSSIDELVQFIEQANAAKLADGWISFYWGKSAQEYAEDEGNFASAFKKAWLERFRDMTPPYTSIVSRERLERSANAEAELAVSMPRKESDTATKR